MPRDFPRPMANQWRMYHVTDICVLFLAAGKAAVVVGPLE